MENVFQGVLCRLSSAGAIAALLTVAGGAIVAYLQQSWQRKKEQKALRSSLMSEIANLRADLGQALMVTRDGIKANAASLEIPLNVAIDFPVYTASLPQVGKLSEVEAQSVISAYAKLTQEYRHISKEVGYNGDGFMRTGKRELIALEKRLSELFSVVDKAYISLSANSFSK